MSRNIGPDGLPLMYSRPHEAECECFTCKLTQRIAVEMAAEYDRRMDRVFDELVNGDNTSPGPRGFIPGSGDLPSTP